MSTTHSVHAHLRTRIQYERKRKADEWNEQNEAKEEEEEAEEKTRKEFKTELRFLQFIRLETSLYTGHSLSVTHSLRTLSSTLRTLVLVFYPSLKIKFCGSIFLSFDRYVFFFLCRVLSPSFASVAFVGASIFGPHVGLTAKHIPTHIHFASRTHTLASLVETNTMPSTMHLRSCASLLGSNEIGITSPLNAFSQVEIQSILIFMLFDYSLAGDFRNSTLQFDYIFYVCSIFECPI